MSESRRRKRVAIVEDPGRGLLETCRHSAPACWVCVANDMERQRDAARTKADALRRVLALAYGAMNHMGDILNDMDAVEPEDEDKTWPAFALVRFALGQPNQDDGKRAAMYPDLLAALAPEPAPAFTCSTPGCPAPVHHDGDHCPECLAGRAENLRRTE